MGVKCYASNQNFVAVTSLGNAYSGNLYGHIFWVYLPSAGWNTRNSAFFTVKF
jgi:hypothetical protein